ncbi:hypothetical protein, partial [Pseudomonas aeruginosa]|uniref:hypothetical protein n=1 Tax=Pseudomonas aeruginosa TaxID=287 RepID=UPI003968E67B
NREDVVVVSTLLGDVSSGRLNVNGYTKLDGADMNQQYGDCSRFSARHKGLPESAPVIALMISSDFKRYRI